MRRDAQLKSVSSKGGHLLGIDETVFRKDQKRDETERQICQTGRVAMETQLQTDREKR